MPNQEPPQNGDSEPKTEPNTGANQETPTGNGESAPDGGGAEEPDYGMILDMLKEVQANQAVIAGKLKSLTDAQSILVDSGAVVHEVDEPESGVQTNFSNDGFISLDKMDLSI